MNVYMILTWGPLDACDFLLSLFSLDLTCLASSPGFEFLESSDDLPVILFSLGTVK